MDIVGDVFFGSNDDDFQYDNLISSIANTQLTADPELLQNIIINDLRNENPSSPAALPLAEPLPAALPPAALSLATLSPESPNDSEQIKQIKQQEKLFKEARQEAIQKKLYNIPEREVKIKKTKKRLSDCDTLIKNLKKIFLKANHIFYDDNTEDIVFWNFTNYFISEILGDELLTQLDNCKDCSVTNFKRLEHAYTKIFKQITEKNIEIKDYFLTKNPDRKAHV